MIREIVKTIKNLDPTTKWFKPQKPVVDITYKISYSKEDTQIIHLLDIPLVVDIRIEPNSYEMTLLKDLLKHDHYGLDNIHSVEAILQTNGVFRVISNSIVDTSKPYFKLSKLCQILKMDVERKQYHIKNVLHKKACQEAIPTFVKNKISQGYIKTCYHKIHIPGDDELSFRFHYVYEDKKSLVRKWIIKSHTKNKIIPVTEDEIKKLCKELNLKLKDLKQEIVLGIQQKKKFRKVIIPSNYELEDFMSFIDCQ